MGHAIIRFPPLFSVQGTLDRDTKLYHIFPLSRFKQMIDDQELYFRKVLKWADTYEYPVRLIHEDRKERVKEGLLGFCFTKEYDIEAMWELYSGNGKYGVCIKTTVSSIYEALKDSIKGNTDFENSAFIGNVLYVPYLDTNPSKMFEYTDKEEYPDYMYPAFIKRDAFSYEKEVRIILYDILWRAHQPDDGLSIKLKNLNFIDEIILSPHSTIDNKVEIEKFCKDKGISAPISQSRLFKKIDENSVALPPEEKVYWGYTKGAYGIT